MYTDEDDDVNNNLLAYNISLALFLFCWF